MQMSDGQRDDLGTDTTFRLLTRKESGRSDRGARKRRTDLVVVGIAADMVDHGGQVVAAITRFEGQSRSILGVHKHGGTREAGN